MIKNHTADSTSTPQHSRPRPGEKAWVTGAAGLMAATVFIFIFQGTASDPWLDTEVMSGTTQTAMGILIATFATMLLVENLRCAKVLGRATWHKAPHIDAAFFANGLLRYLEHLLLLWLIQVFYQTANEYGFARQHPFYQPWHQFYDLFFTAYIWLGLPYIWISRALRWTAPEDNRDFGILLELGFWRVVKGIPALGKQAPKKSPNGQAIFLDLLVKLFFLPLFLVFFTDQLQHLYNNLRYVAAGMPEAYVDGQLQLTQWNFDIANLVTSALFSLHSALAFSSIAMSSRWLNRANIAINPRLIGWLPCLLTYPPFIHIVITQHIPGVTGPHLDGPSPILEQLPNAGWLTLAVLLMSGFYLIYLFATVSLGAHYSQLTNRGIVRSGAYAWVRHPAYSAKLLGWLSVWLPLILLNAVDGNWLTVASLTGAYTIGVALYIARALTEEKHLSDDPDYVDYCRGVRWRFIPKVW